MCVCGCVCVCVYVCSIVSSQIDAIIKTVIQVYLSLKREVDIQILSTQANNCIKLQIIEYIIPVQFPIYIYLLSFSSLDVGLLPSTLNVSNTLNRSRVNTKKILLEFIMFSFPLLNQHSSHRKPVSAFKSFPTILFLLLFNFFYYNI